MLTKPALHAAIVGALFTVHAGLFVFARRADAPAAASSPPAVAAVDVVQLGSVRDAVATVNAGSGWLDVVAADHALACGPAAPLPASCATARRVRIGIPPDLRDPGVYPIGGRGVFAYLDEQHLGHGACSTRGSRELQGTVEIVAASPEAPNDVTLRVRSDAFEGTVHARPCPSCAGTGLSCSSNAACCTNLCSGGRCRP
jgi:hypothetical protein